MSGVYRCAMCGAPAADWNGMASFIAPTASEVLTCASVDVCSACIPTATAADLMAAADRVHAARVAKANDAVPAGKVTP